MIKNLTVTFDYKTVISSKEIHSLISFLKKELTFTVDFLEVLFVDTDKMISYNKKYLAHDYSTDVISLSFSDHKLILEGLIIISVPEAGKNAKIYKVEHRDELFRLVIHGILHLVGYDDGSKKERGIMKKQEDYLLSKFSTI
ncbi:MAG: rRNA maturation RNase YbeY [Ignavibacteriaceae bacterium]